VFFTTGVVSPSENACRQSVRDVDRRCGGAEAVSCEECGYVGVEADHSGEPRAVETWAEALERFARRE